MKLTNSELISLVHAAQVDAGSLDSFTKKVDTELDGAKSDDPVAAFTARIIENGGDLDDFGYYRGEINRIVTAISKRIIEAD